MTTTIDARRPPRTEQEISDTLRASAGARPDRFSSAMLRQLPEPARRWLGHAISPGAPLARRAELEMHGRIRLRRNWHSFTARQILVPGSGFVWAAHTTIAGLPVSGFDGYAGGLGTMRWHVLGVPVIRQSGDGTTRSAIDRLAAESVLLPSSLLDAQWRRTNEPDEAIYGRRVEGHFSRSPVRISVNPDGRLLRVQMQRWGNPDGRGHDLHPFVVTFDGEFDAGTMRVPDGIHASWPRGGGEFFQASLDAVTLS